MAQPLGFQELTAFHVRVSQRKTLGFPHPQFRKHRALRNRPHWFKFRAQSKPYAEALASLLTQTE